jgi:hypothetical protein
LSYSDFRKNAPFLASFFDLSGLKMNLFFSDSVLLKKVRQKGAKNTPLTGEKVKCEVRPHPTAQNRSMGLKMSLVSIVIMSVANHFGADRRLP